MIIGWITCCLELCSYSRSILHVIKDAEAFYSHFCLCSSILYLNVYTAALQLILGRISVDSPYAVFFFSNGVFGLTATFLVILGKAGKKDNASLFFISLHSLRFGFCGHPSYDSEIEVKSDIYEVFSSLQRFFR